MNTYFLGLKSFGIRRFACFLLLLIGITGCHPAALVIPSYIQNVGVDLFENRTSYYGLDTIFTEATIRQFQIDGRLPIETADKADMAVKVIIRQYIREPQLYANNTNYVLEYRLSVVYDLAAIDQREKKTFLEDTGKVHSIYFYTPQYTGAIPETEDQAITQLASDMAYTIVRRVLEGN